MKSPKMGEDLTMLKERLELSHRLSIYHGLQELNRSSSGFIKVYLKAKKSFAKAKIEHRSTLKAPSDVWIDCSLDLE